MPIVNLHRSDPLVDGRQSPSALLVRRGVQRALLQLKIPVLTEFCLKNGRRADLVGVTDRGEIWIIEIKSSLNDLKSDNKWHEYQPYCDRLFFASHAGVAMAHFPSQCGFILADYYGAQIIRQAPEHRLHSTRRKSLLLDFTRQAALRLTKAELDGFTISQEL